ncbi:hypothetical protein O181_011693 [Austropuccinia psidii MF-1]|uniref:Uncharacterized protein n=1 Tax=Austropuccinia psidii MF-1 TaxID=1389203 RepID=A0A9Q3BVC4_9BASI|nr:hypothetical protein [Austropuccinia psidii MF-1]
MPPKRNQKKSQTASKTTSKAPSKVSTPQVPGTPLEVLPPKPLGTAIVGINFGQTSSSLAIINKDGTADCLANDDGERQIPSVISFSGSQTYVGNPARLQLVRNQANTIVGFRNLLGKSFDQVKSIKPLYNSGSIVNKDGQPAFLIRSESDDAAANAPTEQLWTVADITKKYLETLFKYAEDFIGRKADAAVLAIPDWFTPQQTDILRSIVEDQLGVKILQFITEASASSIASDPANSRLNKPAPDANLLVLDVGGSSSTATILSRRNGLVLPLATSTDLTIGGNCFEDIIMEYFVKEFNKKNKTNLDLSDQKNHKSAIKLRLATEITKKTLSASNSANCSVDSLYDGYDFSGSINRMRCDLLLSKYFAQICKLVADTVAKSGLNKEEIDNAILAGGSTKLPAIKEQLIYALHPNLKIECPIEPDEIIAIGCALQADLIIKRYPLQSPQFSSEFQPSLGPTCLKTQCLSKPLGLLFPSDNPDAPAVFEGKRFITLLPAMTPLPVKKVFNFPVLKPGKATTLPIDLWQGEPHVMLADSSTLPNGQQAADEEDEDEDEEPERVFMIKPSFSIAHVDLPNVKEGGSAQLVLTIEGNKGTLAISSIAKGVETHTEATFTLS